MGEGFGALVSPGMTRRAPRAAALLLAMLTLAPLAPPGGASHLPVPAACFQGNDVDVMLVLDRSSSMLATDGNPTNRLQDAKNAANGFLALLGPDDHSGLVSFSTGWTLDKTLSANHAATQSAVNAQVANGATSLYAGIRLGLYELLNQFHDPHPDNGRVGVPGVQQVLIVLTDGAQTDSLGFLQTPPGSPSPIWEAQFGKNNGVIVFVIALGNDPSLPPWYPTLQATATSPQHFFIAASGANLAGVFSQISQRIRDAQDPTVAIGTPVPGRLHVNGANVAASPLGADPAVRHWVDATATAADDCQVVEVTWSVDRYDAQGQFLGTQPLASVNPHLAPYRARIDCDALGLGRHLLHAQVRDFVDKTNATSRWFWCIAPSIAAQGQALFAWATNPADLQVRNVGATLPGPFGGADRSVTAQFHNESLVYLDASLLFDDVTGSMVDLNGQPSRGRADALSRVLNLTFPTFDPAGALGPLVVNALQRIEVLEAEVNVTIDADAAGPTWLARSLTGRSATVCAMGYPLDWCGALPPQVQTSCFQVSQAAVPGVAEQVEACEVSRFRVDDLTIILGEQVRRSGPGFEELTVNALHLVRDTAEQRTEIILGQAYGGVSLVGPGVLAGPHRSLDQPNDAGLGRDASDDPAAPEVLLGPGVFQGRVAPGDRDSYGLPVVPGQKLQVTFLPADGAHVTVRPIPTPPASQNRLPQLGAVLLDDDLDVHDTSLATAAGAPVEVELNVDEPGVWRWTVAAVPGKEGDYTMVVTRTDAPMTQDDDALLQVDAGEGCGDALLVGPGVHLGTLELGDAADAYRFNAQEGQQVAVVLRPGDTLQAADMDLSILDPACNLIAFSGGAKGQPEIAQFTAPVGGTGLYRAVVHHAHGIGLYQLVIAPIPVTA